MKIYVLLLLFLITSIGFAQNNHIVNTEDGRRVLLKADFTWEYIDAENTSTTSIINPNCNLAENFEEPKLNKKIQAQLKKGRATINYVKRKVAKDYNCAQEDVLLISVTEQNQKLFTIFAPTEKKLPINVLVILL